MRAALLPSSRALALGAVAALTVLLTGCVPEPIPSSRDTSASPRASVASDDDVTLSSVIDGDTIRTSIGTVRIIGIDTPERGECGYEDAASALEELLGTGSTVALERPPGQNDQDRHGRLLRYAATASGMDLGLAQVQAGHAVARYDSEDGYPAHPREVAYREAQTATLTADGTVIPPSCSAPPPTPAPDEQWWTQYPSCSALKKNAVGHPTGPFSRDDPAQAEAYQWFAIGTGNNGDGDGDGLACE